MQEKSKDQMQRLQELLQQSPSGAAFKRIVALFKYWNNKETLETALAYSETQLEDWPDETRTSKSSEFWPRCPHGTPVTAFQLVRGLDLSKRSARFDVERFFDSPHLSCLRVLNLSGGGSWSKTALGSDDVKAIAASPYLSQLNVLDLSMNDIGDAGAKLLASSSSLSNLVRLDLGGNTITEEGARALADGRYFSNLKSLEVTFALDKDGVESAMVLGLSAHLPKIVCRPYLKGMKVLMLQREARRLELNGYSKLSKAELIEALLVASHDVGT